MRILLLALVLNATSRPSAPIALDVDGIQYGVFAAMESADDGVIALTLVDGRVERGFFDLWWPQSAGAGDLLAPGEHRVAVETCTPRPVTLRQISDGGLRARQRSWTLLDACPVAWTVGPAEPGENSLRLDSLSFRSAGLGVAR